MTVKSRWTPILFFFAWAALTYLAIGSTDALHCVSLELTSGVQTKYRPMVGCMVKTRSGWVPEKNWRE